MCLPNYSEPQFKKLHVDCILSDIMNVNHIKPLCTFNIIKEVMKHHE